MTRIDRTLRQSKLRDLVVHGRVNDSVAAVSMVWDYLTSPTMRYKATGRYDFFKPIAPLVMGDRDENH